MDQDIERYGGLPPEDAIDSPSIFYGGVEYTVGQHVLGGYMQRQIEQKYGEPYYGGAQDLREMSHYILAGANGPTLIALQNIIMKKDKVINLLNEKIKQWQSSLTCTTHPHAVFFSLPEFQVNDDLVKRAASDPDGLVSLTNMIIG